jgi:aminoglycoside phosphotransferase (APT) family kinase protein
MELIKTTFCHNDIWGDNIIRNEKELFVIDFGDADWGFRGWDLAYFFLHNQSLGKFLKMGIKNGASSFASLSHFKRTVFTEHLFATFSAGVKIKPIILTFLLSFFILTAEVERFLFIISLST